MVSKLQCFTIFSEDIYIFILKQDYKVHRDEIHTKLVQIMRERLLVHLRSLPQIVEGWNRPEDSDPQPSQFARSLTKVTIFAGSVTIVNITFSLIF